MDLNEKDIALLEAWWSGELTGPEGRALEQRMEQDAAFRKAAFQMKATLAALQSANRERTKDYLRSLRGQEPPVPAKKNRATSAWVKIALIVLVGLVLGLLAWLWCKAQQPATTDERAIAMAFFEPFPAYGITKDGSREGLRLQAQRAYAAKDYKAAIPLLERAFTESGDSSLLFYAGVAHLGNGEAARAAGLLQPLQHAAIEEQEAVGWYLALAQLQLGEKEAALRLLDGVKENSEGYSEQAMELEAAIGEEK